MFESLWSSQNMRAFLNKFKVSSIGSGVCAKTSALAAVFLQRAAILALQALY